jgi:hypothetical protein
MFKNAYGEECLWRTRVFEWHKWYIEAQKVRMQKSRVKGMLTTFFDAKGIIIHKFVPKKRTANGKFHREVIKKLVARVHRLRPEFQESGSWYVLPDSVQGHSSGFVSEFLAKRGIPVLSHPPYSPDLAPAAFFSIP